MAHFNNVVEMLHDLDEAEHRAENADGGGEAAGRLEDSRQSFFGLRRGFHADLHNFAQFAGFCTVNGQHQGLAQKRILNRL